VERLIEATAEKSEHTYYGRLIGQRYFAESDVRAMLASLPPASSEPTEDVVERVKRALQHAYDQQFYGGAGHGMTDRMAAALAEAAVAAMSASQCSFYFLPATTDVDDESGLMPSCAKCAAAWKLDPGFVKEAPNPAPDPELRQALEEVAAHVRAWGYADTDDWPRLLARVDAALTSSRTEGGNNGG
jgi:hypothetical protein